MNRSVINSLVTMQGLQQKLDIIANNIANSNTLGFKRKEATFHDILTSRIRQPEQFNQPGRLSSPGLTQGAGSRLGMVQINLSQGNLQMTENPLDLAIEGDALFEVEQVTIDANGNRIVQPVWTKEGSFSFSVQPNDPDNVYLTTKDGKFVRGVDDQPIRVPLNHRIQVDSDGNIMAYNEAVREALPISVGQIKIVHVFRPQLLEQIGNNLLSLKNNADNANGEVLQPLDALQGDRPPVSIRQGFVEQTNVDLTNEMTEMILVQRAMQLNSRALTSSDNLINLANNLRG